MSAQRDFVRAGPRPQDDLIHHRNEIPALLREAIFDLGRNHRILLSVNEAALFELLQFPAENTGRDRLSQRADEE